MKKRKQQRREKKPTQQPLCKKHHKRAHASHESALGSAAFMSLKTGLTLRVYRDPTCGYWHLTKRKPQVRKVTATPVSSARRKPQPRQKVRA